MDLACNGSLRSDSHALWDCGVELRNIVCATAYLPEDCGRRGCCHSELHVAALVTQCFLPAQLEKLSLPDILAKTASDYLTGSVQECGCDNQLLKRIMTEAMANETSNEIAPGLFLKRVVLDECDHQGRALNHMPVELVFDQIDYYKSVQDCGVIEYHGQNGGQKSHWKRLHETDLIYKKALGIQGVSCCVSSLSPGENDKLQKLRIMAQVQGAVTVMARYFWIGKNGHGTNHYIISLIIRPTLFDTSDFAVIDCFCYDNDCEDTESRSILIKKHRGTHPWLGGTVTAKVVKNFVEQTVATPGECDWFHLCVAYVYLSMRKSLSSDVVSVCDHRERIPTRYTPMPCNEVVQTALMLGPAVVDKHSKQPENLNQDSAERTGLWDQMLRGVIEMGTKLGAANRAKKVLEIQAQLRQVYSLQQAENPDTKKQITAVRTKMRATATAINKNNDLRQADVNCTRPAKKPKVQPPESGLCTRDEPFGIVPKDELNAAILTHEGGSSMVNGLITQSAISYAHKFVSEIQKPTQED